MNSRWSRTFRPDVFCGPTSPTLQKHANVITANGLFLTLTHKVAEMYEEEILKELKIMNERLARLEEVFRRSSYGGSDFVGCLTRIMYGAEE